jgi:hypothetical protein
VRRDPADEAFYQAAIARARAQAAAETTMGEASGRSLSAADALREARSFLLPMASATGR